MLTMPSAARRLLLPLLALLVLLPSAASACGPYRVAFYEYSVLYRRDADGKYRGIDKDMVEELSRRSGCKFETVLEPRARTWALMASGGVDITVSAVVSRERESLVDMVPYLQSRRAVLLRTTSLPTTAQGFVQDERLRLLMVRATRDGPQMEALLTQLRAQGRLTEAADQPSAIRAFKAGRADALLIGAASLAELRKADPDINAYKAVFWAPTERIVLALALSRERVLEADRSRLRESLLAMRLDGTLDAILRRHLGDQLASAVRLPDGDPRDGAGPPANPESRAGTR